jgi:predicted transcriptional regulator
MREQIADYLAQGYTQSEVAKIVGVTEPTISEYVKDEGFKELLKDKAVQYVGARIDKKYSNLEEKVLNKLTGITTDGFAEVGDLVKILDAVSRNKHKSIPTGNLIHPTIGITLVMNASQQPNVVLDTKNQVIEIDGSTMKAMPLLEVKQLFGKIERDQTTEKQNEQRRIAQAA